MKLSALFLFLPALACAAAAAQAGQAVAAQQAAQTNPLAVARVFSFDGVMPKTAPNGSVGRNVFSGTLATGEAVAAHETVQPARTVPNPAHRIQHSELILVQEGTLEFQHDGVTERATAGSIIYVALGTLHAVKNVGDAPAKYVVIQIGGDTKK
jgi:quercetin dioxygenase-like cupin family protein